MSDPLFSAQTENTSPKLDELATDIAIVAQSWCMWCEDYSDIKTLVCELPVEHVSFTAHDRYWAG